MPKTQDLGRRLELQAMDKHCHDISLALYQREVEQVPHFLVHTYSSVDGARQRADYLTRALIAILGLQKVPDSAPWLRFSCHGQHERALKRAFLDLTKLETGSPLEPKPLTQLDKKAGCNVTAVSLGQGTYEITCQDTGDLAARRIKAMVRGYMKICEMPTVENSEHQFAFACGHSHDELISFLMYRAQNVRAAMAEEEMSGTRGVLAAPSADS